MKLEVNMEFKTKNGTLKSGIHVIEIDENYYNNVKEEFRDDVLYEIASEWLMKNLKLEYKVVNK